MSKSSRSDRRIAVGIEKFEVVDGLDPSFSTDFGRNPFAVRDAVILERITDDLYTWQPRTADQVFHALPSDLEYLH